MVDPDKMSRKDLFKAKERVEQQLERLSYHMTGSFPSYLPNPKTGMRDELIQILDEINTELAETQPKDA